jgi:antitoxin (DNA-binding transcriptional repressor) of toxin-antitoxin stability system
MKAIAKRRGRALGRRKGHNDSASDFDRVSDRRKKMERFVPISTRNWRLRRQTPNMLRSATQTSAGKIMETIGEQDLGPRAAELLDRLSRGETFEVVRNGQMIGKLVPRMAEASEPPSLKDLIMNGPSLEGVLLPRDRSPIREVEL